MGTDAVPEVKKEDSDDLVQITNLEGKIIRQVEHYFGDFNLRKDKFLKEQITLDDGWVPLETLVKFNRLKTLSEDFGVICGALKKSSSGLLEIDEESNKIRRSADKPVPDEALGKDEMLNRCVYVKGFKKTTTLDDLLDFFQEHKAEHISMRHLKPPNKGFKGSCFVTFETLEDAEKFLGLSGIKYQGTELLREKKKDYTKRKDELYQNIRKEKENKRQQRAEAMKKDGEGFESKMVPGCLLKITGLSSGLTREDLKAPLEKYGKVVYVDYSKGKPEGIVRFETGVAKDALEGLSTEEDGVKKIEFKDVKATVTLIEGEEEEEYWKNIAISRASKFRNSEFQRQNKGRFNKHQKWDRRGKRQNRNEENEDPPSKGVKREASSEDAPSKRVKREESSEDKSNSNGNKQEPVKREAEIEGNDGPPSKKIKTEESCGDKPETAMEVQAN